MQTTGTAITGTGAWHPPTAVTNEQLCDAFNTWVRGENRARAGAIDAGEAEALAESSPAFIAKASGIEQRYVYAPDGVLDPERLCPHIPRREADERSAQADFAVAAAESALAEAGRVGEEIDLVICTASNLQRPYPAIAIEVQDALGARGNAYDMLAGCSSATNAIIQASLAIQGGAATRALVVTPELMCGHVNWRDRDQHFIFGDAASAAVVEPAPGGDGRAACAFEILSMRAVTRFSNNIRNDGGYLDRCDPDGSDHPSKLFHQQGRRVFKDVVPMASRFIADHLAAAGVEVSRLARLWLHQANRSMVELIARRLFGRDPAREELPLILAAWGNTSSAGSVIAFDLHKRDLPGGALGLLSSFGAGYSLASLILRRV